MMIVPSPHHKVQWTMEEKHLFKDFSIYRGFLPNATFGSGKNSHQPKFALAKCNLANANFGLFISLVRFVGYFCPKNRSNEINRPKIALAKYKNRSNKINSPENA